MKTPIDGERGEAIVTPEALGFTCLICTRAEIAVG